MLTENPGAICACPGAAQVKARHKSPSGSRKRRIEFNTVMSAFSLKSALLCTSIAAKLRHRHDIPHDITTTARPKFKFPDFAMP
jgi:hypothetical protein